MSTDALTKRRMLPFVEMALDVASVLELGGCIGATTCGIFYATAKERTATASTLSQAVAELHRALGTDPLNAARVYRQELSALAEGLAPGPR